MTTKTTTKRKARVKGARAIARGMNPSSQKYRAELSELYQAEYARLKALDLEAFRAEVRAICTDWDRKIGGWPPADAFTNDHDNIKRVAKKIVGEGRLAEIRRGYLVKGRAIQAADHKAKLAAHKAACDAGFEAKEAVRKAAKRARLEAKRNSSENSN